METKILGAVMEDRNTFNAIKDKINLEDTSEEFKLIYRECEKYYAKDESAEKIDRVLFNSILYKKYETHKDTLEIILNNIICSSIPNIVDYLGRLHLEQYGYRLACTLGSPAFDIKKIVSQCEEFIEEYNSYSNLIMNSEDIFSIDYLDSIIKNNDINNVINLSPKSLDLGVGKGVCRKHHILLFGRPEIGKSALSITLACGAAIHGKKVIYFCNEDPEDIMRERMLSCITGYDKFKLRANLNATKLLADKRNINNIGFIALSPGNIYDIKDAVREHLPDVFIIDQIRNISMGKAIDKNRVQQLEQVCQHVRNIAQEFNALAISVTQAGNSAHNKSILEMNDIDFSNTGMQAHADLIIGMGSNPDMEEQGIRMLSLPKNKINGKHLHFPVKLEQSIHRVIDI